MSPGGGRRLTGEQLRGLTLRRQFPAIRGRGPAAVLSLLDGIGPIQSQVPRAPFLAASSRLPGVSYATMTELFEQHRLVKASTLRGTVHTSSAEVYRCCDAVARAGRGSTVSRALGLTSITPESLHHAIEEFCRDRWPTREEVVAYAKAWIAELEPGISINDTVGESYLWGHSGLLRRPVSSAWESRTDSLRRRAADVVNGPWPDAEEARIDLVRRHLAAYGPAQREDLAFFLAATPRQITTAVTRLGAEVRTLPGPDGSTYLDLVDPPPGGRSDPGLRLLGEFDGLLLGYALRNRTRFIDEDHLPLVWNKINATCRPMVLLDQQIRGSWRTVGAGTRPRLEVIMFPGMPAPPQEPLFAQARAIEQILGVTFSDVVTDPR